jgi:hypothetical protein
MVVINMWITEKRETPEIDYVLLHHVKELRMHFVFVFIDKLKLSIDEIEIVFS